MRIHPERSIEPINELIAVTENPYHRRLLENFREHLTAEILGDLDRIMKTMARHPVYHSYSALLGAGKVAEDGRDSIIVNGREENIALYKAAVDSGRNILELDIRRLAVADWGVIGDGYIYVTNHGSDLAAEGVPGIDPDATYIVESRLVFVLPHEDGLMTGEDTYRAPNSIKHIKLAPDEIVRLEDIPLT